MSIYNGDSSQQNYRKWRNKRYKDQKERIKSALLADEIHTHIKVNELPFIWKHEKESEEKPHSEIIYLPYI